MPSAPLRPQQRMSIELFRCFYEGRPDEERWELIDGVAIRLAPSTLSHQRLASNLQFLLHEAFEHRASTLAVYQRVGINLGPSIEYNDFSPDVVVVDEEICQDPECRYADRFYLVGEIVSSSDRVDVNRKREIYKLHEHCTCILTVQQERVEVRVDRRTEAGWTEETLRKLDDVFALPDFGLRCKVSDLYRGTPLLPRQPSC
jgi:Uma2 family endonuclease